MPRTPTPKQRSAAQRARRRLRIRAIRELRASVRLLEKLIAEHEASL